MMSISLPVLGASVMDVNPGLTFWTIITFVVVLVILRLTAWKPIVAMLDEREKTIREAIDGAKRERLEAERLLAEQKDAIAQARREAAELVRRNQAEVDAARQTAIAKAKEEADSLLESARRSIEEERAKAIADIRATTVDLALAAAGKLLEVNLDEQKHRKLAEEFLDKLPQRERISA